MRTVSFLLPFTAPARHFLWPTIFVCRAIPHRFCKSGTKTAVGYHTQTWMPADYVMMGCQFEGTGDSHIKLSQLNLGADFDGPWYGEGPDEYKVTAPQIQLSFEGREGIANYCYFVHDAIPLDDSGENFGPGWLDPDGEPVDPDMILGLGFWYRDTFNKNRFLQNAGQVNGEPVWEKSFNRDYRMLTPAYPKAVKLSEITFVDIDNEATWYGDGPDDFKKTATQLQVPFANREGIQYYLYYLADGIPLDDSGENFGPGWVDADGEPVDLDEIIIPAGRGCWFRPSPNYPKTLMTVQFAK